jgi:uncharacterized protein (TIGR00290 family)
VFYFVPFACAGRKMADGDILGDLHMVDSINNAAILWTGGKDSALALYEAYQNGYNVDCLVTFAPPQANFLSHPLSFIKLQAQALILPHYVLHTSVPYEQSYEAGLCKLRDELNIKCIFTGDISEVDGYPNWIRERSRPVGLSVYTPLWGRDRNALLKQLMEHGFKVRFSGVQTRWLKESWVGRELNDATINELHNIHEQNGLDLCGEQGEFHTLVVDGPYFSQGIDIRSFSILNSDPLAYMDIHEMELIGHTA